MKSLDIALYGLGGTAFFGIISVMLQKLVKKGMDKIDKPSTEKREQELKTITKEQEIISNQINQANAASEETKKKIKKILKTTATKVQEALNEDAKENIDKQLDEGWEDL